MRTHPHARPSPTETCAGRPGPRRPSLGSALSALEANLGPIFWAALAFMFLFLVWLRISELLFALTFPAGTT